MSLFCQYRLYLMLFELSAMKWRERFLCRFVAATKCAGLTRGRNSRVARFHRRDAKKLWRH